MPMSLIHPAISLSGCSLSVLDLCLGFQEKEKKKAHQTHQGIILVLLFATPAMVLRALELLAHTIVISHRDRIARHDSVGAYQIGKGLFDNAGGLMLLIRIDCLLGDDPAHRLIGVSVWRGSEQTRQT